ncbi:hypothetical protein EB796_005052 [Bugula neritina]|uniref:DIRC2 n=1 Tax=Bugula neritina TaxID=10212 RepID=A0A7J7KDD2_BUGNE|nr:hypothetical protein EB796_005052 [Bugula neritina]
MKAASRFSLSSSLFLSQSYTQVILTRKEKCLVERESTTDMTSDINSVTTEKSALLPLNNSVADSTESSDEIRTYQRRWWILVVFCVCASNQSYLWNTWAPIADATQIAFGWPKYFPALLLGVSNALSAVMAFPIMYFIEKTDLRQATVLSSFLMVMCIIAWNIALQARQKWLIVVGAALNGITGAVTMASPSLLSVTWFPTSERAIATAFAVLSGYTGNGLAFITGPYISGANVTVGEVRHRKMLDEGFITSLRLGILKIMYYGATITFIGFLMTMLYFPPGPPKKPSEVQNAVREEFISGFKKIAKNHDFWLLSTAYNLSNALFNSWLPLSSINFRSLNIDEVTAGWIGFTAIMTSSVSSVFISYIMNYFKKRVKLFLQLANLVALTMFVILICIQRSYIFVPPSFVTTSLYILCTGAAISINGVIPLYYELACDSAFPADEGLTGSVIVTVNNLLGFTVLMLFLHPTLALDTEWMTWSCLGACVLTIPMLFFMKENYNRLDIDSGDSTDIKVLSKGSDSDY